MTAAHDQEARARALATRLVRGPNVGAGDGDTYIPRTPTIDELAAAFMSFAAEREAIVREECACIAEGRAGYRKRGETIAAAIRGNARERAK